MLNLHFINFHSSPTDEQWEQQQQQYGKRQAVGISMGGGDRGFEGTGCGHLWGSGPLVRSWIHDNGFGPLQGRPWQHSTQSQCRKPWCEGLGLMSVCSLTQIYTHFWHTFTQKKNTLANTEYSKVMILLFSPGIVHPSGVRPEQGAAGGPGGGTEGGVWVHPDPTTSPSRYVPQCGVPWEPHLPQGDEGPAEGHPILSFQHQVNTVPLSSSFLQYCIFHCSIYSLVLDILVLVIYTFGLQRRNIRVSLTTTLF